MCFIYYDRYGITHAVDREETAQEYSIDGQYYLSTLENKHGFLKDYNKLVDIRDLSEYIVDKRGKCNYLRLLGNVFYDFCLNFISIERRRAPITNTLYDNPFCTLLHKLIHRP